MARQGWKLHRSETNPWSAPGHRLQRIGTANDPKVDNLNQAATQRSETGRKKYD